MLLGCFTPSHAGNDYRAPDVPAALQVPVGNKISFRAYAVGVQIYVAIASASSATGYGWTFRAPEAVLYDADGKMVGLHYAGPTWETDSGSKVVGSRVAGATPNATAIPWLLLQATSTQGPGILARTTYIQRMNTTGGLAPAIAPIEAGQEVSVPYTAKYVSFAMRVKQSRNTQH
jgi:hypothetical protein